MTMQTLEFIPRCFLCGQHCWGVPGECEAADKRHTNHAGGSTT